MENPGGDVIWHRVRDGLHTAVLGLEHTTPNPLRSPPPEVLVIPASCANVHHPLGMFAEVRQRIERMSESSVPLLDLATERVKSGLLRRFLGEEPPPEGIAAVVEDLNRLQRQLHRPCALILENVEQADLATQEALRTIVARPGWCRVPLILAFQHATVTGQSFRLLEALRLMHGDEAVIQLGTHAEAAAGSRAGRKVGAGGVGEAAHLLEHAVEAAGAGSPLGALSPEVGLDPLRALHEPDTRVEEGGTWDSPSEETGISGGGGQAAAARAAAVQRGEVHPGPASRSVTTLSAVTPTSTRAQADAEAVARLEPESGTDATSNAASIADPLEKAAIAPREAVAFAVSESSAVAGVSAAAGGALTGTPGLSVGTALVKGAMLRPLSPQTRRVLRVGALQGPRFSASAIGRVLALSVRQVLEELQEAADLGIPLLDEGNGWLELPEPVWIQVVQDILPSLARTWRAGLAQSEAPARDVAPESAPATPVPATPAPETPAPETPAPETPEPALAAATTEASVRTEPAPSAVPDAAVVPSTQEAERPVQPGEGLSNPLTPASSLSATAPEKPEPVRTEVPRPAPQPSVNEGIPGGQAPRNPGGSVPSTGVAGASGASPSSTRPRIRATGLREERTSEDQLVMRLLENSEQAASSGAHPEAIRAIRQALNILRRQPVTEPRRLLLVRAYANLGRNHWAGANRGMDFNLLEAHQFMTQALELIKPGDPPVMVADVRAQLASVCYDLGDPAALDQALEQLTQASRELQEAGDSEGAARFLNDQAAVWIRLGDPVRAHHLLMESKKVFESRASQNRVAAEELAETNHLLARLMFHVPPRPGREDDAIEVGLQHARLAEEGYRALKNVRELARVWESIGRLLMKGGQPQQALEVLERALQAQQQLGDMIGLARTTGAVAELLCAAGDLRRGLLLMRESLALNQEKLSAQGLYYNRQSFDAILKQLSPQQRQVNQLALGTLAAELGRAEARMERIRPSTRG